jgi:hypothetical protein
VILDEALARVKVANDEVHRREGELIAAKSVLAALQEGYLLLENRLKPVKKQKPAPAAAKSSTRFDKAKASGQNIVTEKGAALFATAAANSDD